jgi:hypothetical protein
MLLRKYWAEVFLCSVLQAVVSKAMLAAMKNILSNSLLIFTLIVSSAASAALYKGLDDEGNVVYSDAPFDEAEKFTPPPISVMDKPKAGAGGKAVEEEKPAEFKYTQFDIVSPLNKQTIRNEPELTVTLSLKPGLNTEEEHTVWLLFDGKPLIKNSQKLTFNLGRVERGAHKLQAQVRDKAGKIIVSTRISAIFVHQTAAP